MEIACVLVPEPLLRAAAEERRLPAEDVWEEELRRLEAQVGAGVESERAGEAFFALDGLLGIHGGERAGVLAAARRATRLQVRIGVAPTRFAAFSAAADGELVVPASRLREYLSHVPVPALVPRLGLAPREAAGLVETMGRLGIETLGALASLSAAQVADRFGAVGSAVHRIARGEESPPRPRRPHEELAVELELPEGTAGDRLDHALGLLVDRLLAAPRRRGRTLLTLRLGAVLAEGGSWSVEQGLGRPTASARVLRAVLAPRLEALPAPAVTLRLRAPALGPPAAEQMELSIRGQEARRRRLGAAVREVRAAQGAEALLRILPVNPASRVPERRAILTPFPAP